MGACADEKTAFCGVGVGKVGIEGWARVFEDGNLARKVEASSCEM